MDGAPEAAFDRVTRLVAEVLHVPVALFTLVTDDRQVFKSSVGVGDTRETPLSHSFCRHVVDSGAPLEVVDARLHPRVRDNPAIEDFGIVAYLGMPLTTKDGDAARRAVRDRPRAAPVDRARPRRARGPGRRGDGRDRAAARQPRRRRRGRRAALRRHARHADAAAQPARAARGPRPVAAGGPAGDVRAARPARDARLQRRPRPHRRRRAAGAAWRSAWRPRSVGLGARVPARRRAAVRPA